MKLVLDANIFFSLMKPESTASYLFSSVKAEFSAPEFMKSEIKKHKPECLLKSGLSEYEFEIRQEEVEERIMFLKVSEYEQFLEKAVKTVSDPDDMDFLATAISTGAAIWSNDSLLKRQSLAPVITTNELIGMFLKGEI